MSTHVVGFRPADEQWNKMKAAWEACVAAGVDVPVALYRFFNEEPPGNRPGCEVDITCAIQEWSDNKSSKAGIDIDLSKIPENVKVIRFYNSW